MLTHTPTHRTLSINRDAPTLSRSGSPRRRRPNLSHVRRDFDPHRRDAQHRRARPPRAEPSTASRTCAQRSASPASAAYRGRAGEHGSAAEAGSRRGCRLQSEKAARAGAVDDRELVGRGLRHSGDLLRTPQLGVALGHLRCERHRGLGSVLSRGSRGPRRSGREVQQHGNARKIRVARGTGGSAPDVDRMHSTN
jgi:hypothetical protein